MTQANASERIILDKKYARCIPESPTVEEIVAMPFVLELIELEASKPK